MPESTLPPENDAELERVIELARGAGALILEVVASAALGVRDKGDGQGPVTKADLAADGHLHGGLTESFPTDLIITEETWTTGDPIEAGHRVWLVDPLDGTKEFVAGRTEYSVMIGLAIDGVPELGVVYQPAIDRLWAGRVSTRTAFTEVDGARRALPELPALTAETRPRLALSRSHRGAVGERAAELFDAEVVSRGSVGLKVAMLIDGEADLYVSGSRQMKVWDTCGPAAILRATGGVIDSVDGSPLTYSGPAAHGAGLRAFRPDGAEVLERRVDDAVRQLELERTKGA